MIEVSVLRVNRMLYGSITCRVLGIALAVLATVLTLALGTYREPESVDEFTPVGHGRVQFLSIDGSSYFEPREFVPYIVSSAGKPFYEQNFDGVYNKLHMRCRFQIVSGLPEQASLDDYRVLLSTPKAKLLLNLHRSGETAVSDEFVCVKGKDILSVPGIKEIEIDGRYSPMATLVRHRTQRPNN